VPCVYAPLRPLRVERAAASLLDARPAGRGDGV